MTSNFSKQTEVKFNILNLCKSKSLYQYGMKILFLDATDKKVKAKWERAGNNIYYGENQYAKVI